MYTGTHWLYLNLAEASVRSFLPAWAAYRGIIATPDVLLDPKGRKTHLGLTPHLVNLFRNHDVIALEKELMLEHVRRTNYSLATSRLNCIYCWPDEGTARLAPKFWANQGRHFDDRYLVDIGVSALNPPTIVDTRWIDRYLINSKKPLKEIGRDWIDRYWSGSIYPWNGETDLPEQPLLECLVEGTALIYGTKLRTDAYSIVEGIAPEAVGILEKGRLGVDLCVRFGGKDEWRLGQILPFLMSNKERTQLEIRHAILLDEGLAGSVNKGILAAGVPQNEINHRALKVFERDTIPVPDLRAVDVNAGWLTEHSELNDGVIRLLTSFFLERGGDVAAAHSISA